MSVKAQHPMPLCARSQMLSCCTETYSSISKRLVGMPRPRSFDVGDQIILSRQWPMPADRKMLSFSSLVTPDKRDEEASCIVYHPRAGPLSSGRSRDVSIVYRTQFRNVVLTLQWPTWSCISRPHPGSWTSLDAGAARDVAFLDIRKVPHDRNQKCLEQTRTKHCSGCDIPL